MENSVDNEIIENSTENTVDETIYNTITSEDLQEITNKLDESIFYQYHIYSTEVIFVAVLFVILVIFLMYKFIIKFIEF